MKGMRIALVIVSAVWIAVLCLVLFVVPAGSSLAKELPNLLFILPLGSALLCYIHAVNLKLPAGSWAFAGLIFPFSTPWILALRAPAPDIEKMKKDGDIDGLVQAMFDRRSEVASDAYVAIGKMNRDFTVPVLLRALPRAGKASKEGGGGGSSVPWLAAGMRTLFRPCWPHWTIAVSATVPEWSTH